MTLELSNSPGKPEIKTWFDHTVLIYTENTTVKITMEDFCSAIYYVLTNTPIEKGDPRLELIGIINKMQLVPNITMEGWPKSTQTFQYKGQDCWSIKYPGQKTSPKYIIIPK